MGRIVALTTAGAASALGMIVVQARPRAQKLAPPTSVPFAPPIESLATVPLASLKL